MKIVRAKSVCAKSYGYSKFRVKQMDDDSMRLHGLFYKRDYGAVPFETVGGSAAEGCLSA
jgi:hypothetical protein